MTEHKNWLHAPRQGRSRETTERIFAAALDMLGGKSIEDISVADLARKAGVSVGAKGMPVELRVSTKRARRIVFTR